MVGNIHFVFHFYQPPVQRPDILDKVVNESYIPFLVILKKHKNVSVLANITGDLINQFQRYGHTEVLDLIKELVASGQLSILEGMQFHPIMTYIYKDMISFQYNKHKETMKSILNIELAPLFYPPELYIDDKTIDYLKELGIKNIIVSNNINMAIRDNNEEDELYKFNGVNLFVRDSHVSNLLTLPLVLDNNELLNYLEKYFSKKVFSLIVFDVEILGHHFPEKLDLINEIFTRFGSKVNNIINHYKEYDNSNLDTVLLSSWESVLKNNTLIDYRWKSKLNPMHKYQWKLLDLVYKGLEGSKKKKYDVNDLYHGINFWSYSCQFWWASAYPFWHPGNVLEGAYGLMSLYYRIPDKKFFKTYRKRADLYYSKISQNLLFWECNHHKDKLIREYDDFLNQMKEYYENIIHIK